VTGKRVRCDAGPFSWVTSHIFRKTVATRLDEAGLSARQIADQLGHAHPSLTQDVDMGRKVVTAEAAKLLDR
jgi:integrase